MMTDEELIARLRALGRDFDDWDTAADRIEALTAALTAANARADAAEAALAAQIEVDAAIARGHGTEWTHDKETPPGEAIAWCIRNQPHDRIEALLAKVKLMDDLDAINGEKIEDLEAKLAKAEAGLLAIAKRDEQMIWGEDYEVEEAFKDMRDISCATLAEIKGESYE
jgi:hypothetical protein